MGCFCSFRIRNNLYTIGISVFLLIATFILIILFSFDYVEYDFDNNNIISDINKNLNEKLIYSIRLSKSCNSNEEKLILGTWGGTIEGCYCVKMIMNQTCSETLLKQGCITIPSSNTIDYLMLNSNFIYIKKSILSYKDLLVNFV